MAEVRKPAPRYERDGPPNEQTIAVGDIGIRLESGLDFCLYLFLGRVCYRDGVQNLVRIRGIMASEAQKAHEPPNAKPQDRSNIDSRFSLIEMIWGDAVGWVATERPLGKSVKEPLERAGLTSAISVSH